MPAKKRKIARKKETTKSKYDSAWKKVIKQLFKDFLDFFFPDIYHAIDFDKEIYFLDKELKEIDPDSNQGDRVADVLVKVHLKRWEQKVYLHHYPYRSSRGTPNELHGADVYLLLSGIR